MTASAPETPTRARRALLFVPGDDPRKAARAAAGDADAVILDLEDGVAANRKQEARDAVARSLRELDFRGRERIVRLNPVGSGLNTADIEATLPSGPDAFLLPKVESPDQVREVIRRTASAPRPILALIESARGVMNLREIAGADPLLVALMFGAEDLAGDLGAIRTREGAEVAWARGAVVTAAASAGLQAIDTVFVDLNDEPGLREESEAACRMGYSGKMAIHPKQVPVIAAAFTPTDEEIERARRLVEAHTRHQAAGTGVFSLDGRMVDWPMVRAARRLLARGRAAGKA